MKTSKKKLESNARSIQKTRDRWTLDTPKGYRALVEAAASQDGCSRNAWIVALLRQELERRGVAVEEACQTARAGGEEQK